MKLIVCIDDNNGMLFNKRRLSSDIAVINRIIELVGDGKLWLNSYSAKLFAENFQRIITDEDFLNMADSEDYCFAENVDVTEYVDDCSEIVIYSWNRKYPSDLKFPKIKACENRNRVSFMEFKGNSHEKITEEIYK